MKWISVLDYLPCDFGTINSDHNKFLCTDGELIEIMAYFGKHRGIPDWSSYTARTLDVSHWIPLPQLPEE